VILKFKLTVVLPTVLFLVIGTSVIESSGGFADSTAGSSVSVINSDESVSTVIKAPNGDTKRIETEADGTVTSIYPDGKVVIQSNDSSVSTYSRPGKNGLITYSLQVGKDDGESYSPIANSFYMPRGIVNDVFSFPGLSPYLDKRTTFTVQKVQGNVAVCGMTYQGVTLARAPWKFSVTPINTMGDPLQVHYCYGANDSVHISSQAAFGIDRAFFNGDSNVQVDPSDYHPNKAREITITNNSPEDLTATLTDSEGKIVTTRNYLGEATKPTTDTFGFTLEQAKTLLDKYTLSLSSKSYLMSWPIVSTSLWSALDYRELNPFAPCSTLTWIYLPKEDPVAGTVNAPKTASNANMLADIKGALAMLSANSSLKFVYSSDSSLKGKPNVISYDWKHMGSVAGSGGPSYKAKGAFLASSDYSGNAGGVNLSPDVSWGANDLFKGAGNHRSPEILKANRILHAANNGRQWLLVHETMHVLGFDHSIDPASVMYFQGGHTKFTSADLFALKYFYPPCKV
jgi:hypothetical protein